MDRSRLYRYAENYVQQQIEHYEFIRFNSESKSSAEYKKAVRYLLYWQDQLKQIADEEREEMRRDK